MELTSFDYVRLISWLAYFKHGVILNKTQMQKILFMCYGVYYARKDAPLFKDDTPKAWPFGPVFPRTYRHYNEEIPTDLSQDDKRNFLKDKETLIEITGIVDRFYNRSASSLSFWSHMQGSPWEQTVYDESGSIVWNKVIENTIIKSFFEKANWSNGL